MKQHNNEYLSHPSKIINKIRKRWIQTGSMAGVGIDPDVNKIDDSIWREVGGKGNVAEGIFLFNKRIVDATSKYAVDYKVNSNFFQGEQGRRALAETFAYIKDVAPDVLRVCDGKFADVGHTAEKIATEIFGNLDADAVLLNPYMGFDAIEPFVRWKDKLIILCINTSNPSADSIQNLRLKNDEYLWMNILKTCMKDWNYNNNIIPVLSATHADNLVGIRDIIGDTPILLAGIGSQGGEMSSISTCLDSKGYGLLISSSRGILYPEKLPGESFQDASKRAILELKANINKAKK